MTEPTPYADTVAGQARYLPPPAATNPIPNDEQGRRFAYADPPYLGQGKRYAHLHPEAHVWDDPATHTALVERLEDEYPDGWAISLCPRPEALAAYVGPGREWAVWHRPGQSGAIPQRRINRAYELVLFTTSVPNSKVHGPMVSDVFTLGGQNWQLAKNGGTHTGTKPPDFCHWVLDLLGYDPNRDELDDLFPGEGSMSHAMTQHRLDLWTPDKRVRRPWEHRPGGTPPLPLEGAHIDGNVGA